jgi:hypothetical protein
MEEQVFERSAQTKEVGAVLRLTPNALKALRALGLKDVDDGGIFGTFVLIVIVSPSSKGQTLSRSAWQR